MDAARDGVLPLRPLTVGELLDASTGVLRRCGWPLLGLGLVLSAARFALLSAMVASLDIPGFSVWSSPLPAVHLWWVCLACWLGAETVLICVLAAPASAAAAEMLVGPPPESRTGRGRRAGPTDGLRLLAAPGRRWPMVLAIALPLGALATLSVLLCGLPWLVVYGLTGLAVPVLIADRAGPTAALRPLRLVFSGAWRPAGIRLLGYTGWLPVRLAVGIAGAALVGRLPTGPLLTTLLTAVPWVVADAVALPALACLDACIHLENRMRAEGLDIALSRGKRSRAVLETL